MPPAEEQLSVKLSEVSVQDTVPEERPSQHEETTKEEVPQDLRVFELNSDSGKSTPSNNGKKGEGEFNHSGSASSTRNLISCMRS